jgi:hypothetical protein
MTASERNLGRRRAGRGLALALFILHGSAQALPSAAQRETARELMAEARRLHGRGDLKGALGRFSAADAIMNVPTTTFEVAATQAELGKLIEARELLLRLLGTQPGPADPEPFNEARAKALALSQQLAARIGSIVVTASGVSEVDGLEVRVDGELVPKEMIGLRLRVNPGPHQLVARSRGRELSQELDLAEGQVLEVALRFAPPAPPSLADEPGAPAPLARRKQTRVQQTAPRTRSPSVTARTSDPQGSTSDLVYLGAGVGTLGVAVGVVGGISAVLHKNSAETGCTNNVCPPSTWRDLQTAHNMASISNVGFVIGGVGWAFAIGSLLLDRPHRPRQGWRVAPDVSRQGAYVNVARRF